MSTRNIYKFYVLTRSPNTILFRLLSGSIMVIEVHSESRAFDTRQVHHFRMNRRAQKSAVFYAIKQAARYHSIPRLACLLYAFTYPAGYTAPAPFPLWWSCSSETVFRRCRRPCRSQPAVSRLPSPRSQSAQHH